jgi:hypothetical protein
MTFAVVIVLIIVISAIHSFEPEGTVDKTSRPVKPAAIIPEDAKNTDSEYVPNLVTVGFWKLPPSVEEFGASYGGTLSNAGVNYDINAATYITDNATSFIENVTRDPYVRYAEINSIIRIPPNEMENVTIINNSQF